MKNTNLNNNINNSINNNNNNNINLVKPIIVNNKEFNLSLAWIIAFWECDGSTTIYLKPSKTHNTGKQVMLIWEIHQHGVDKELLMAISIFLNTFSSTNFNTEPLYVDWNGKPCKAQEYNGLGNIEVSNKKGNEISWMWRLRIYTQSDILNKLLPILLLIKNNILLNKRLHDINLFINACLLVQSGEHNTIEVNNQLLELSQQLSSKLSFDDKSNLPIIPNNLNNNNVLGFTDAEGCFSFSINNNYVKFSFVITQLASETVFLNRLVEFFGIGNVNVYKAKENNDNAQAVYTVQGKKDLANIIVPFFNNNKLLTIKQYSFERFSRALNIYLDVALSKEEKTILINNIKLELDNKRPVFSASNLNSD